jgi:hypothetical protein
MPNRTEARPAKAVLTYATGRLSLLRLFSTPLMTALGPHCCTFLAGRGPWRVLRVNWPVVARPELHMTFERLKNWLVSWETKLDPWPSFRLALAEHEWVIYE